MTHVLAKHCAPLVLFTLAACNPALRQQPEVGAPAPVVDSAAAPPVAQPVAEPVTPVLRPTAGDVFAVPGRRIDWPGPNEYRSANGSPGPAYWQQRADYTISATLDTSAQSVGGRVTIRYTNNSPDTLRFVWLQLDQNLYRPGSEGSVLFAAESRWGVRGFQGGYDLDKVTVNGKTATPHVTGTLMRLDLEPALAPKGGTATFAMDFRFRVPEHGSDRMGRDGMLYEIAQWYPRMAVYDDVRGWNTDPYLGQGEFYLEYGDMDYAITAPAGYTIAGSGVLQNPAEVLTTEQRARLQQAMRSPRVVSIIAAQEARATPTPGTKTWRFHAEHVRDVAWAGAPDFRWDATNYAGRVLTQAFYQFAKTGKAWEEAAEQTRWSIKTYSERFFPYPYPQATSVAGPVGGMEYPMFVMVEYGENGDPNSVFSTLDHEQGHEWFPMVVGSNERRYAWMDEGLNTYINTFSNEARYPRVPVWPGYIANWRGVVENKTQSPLMTAPDRIDPRALGAIGYRKPAAVLLTLRNHVLDPATFDAALRLYIRRWAFKHPTPADFFRTVEDYAGEDLSWFWRGFFYTTDVLDLGIERVAMRGQGRAREAVVTLRR
ncbi:MAG: M1 family metallopeptidase, partial [Chloroflexota bacterium]|nr:M1 family metallopeptidase [Chloroflexota bacterium]